MISFLTLHILLYFKEIISQNRSEWLSVQKKGLTPICGFKGLLCTNLFLNWYFIAGFIFILMGIIIIIFYIFWRKALVIFYLLNNFFVINFKAKFLNKIKLLL